MTEQYGVRRLNEDQTHRLVVKMTYLQVANSVFPCFLGSARMSENVDDVVFVAPKQFRSGEARFGMRGQSRVSKFTICDDA